MKIRNTSYFMTVMIILIPFVLLSSGIEAGQDFSDIKKLWGELLKREPFAYTVPLVHEPSFLGGTYSKRAKKRMRLYPAGAARTGCRKPASGDCSSKRAHIASFIKPRVGKISGHLLWPEIVFCLPTTRSARKESGITTGNWKRTA